MILFGSVIIIISTVWIYTVQMIYLNRALDVFNTAVVTPLLYVIFTGCVILASAVLFREWSGLSGEDIVGNLCGLLVIVAGIFLLQAFRELNISTKNLPRARKDDTRNVSGSSPEKTSVCIETGLLKSSTSASALNAKRDFHNRTGSYS